MSDHLAGLGLYETTETAQAHAAELLEGAELPANTPPPAERAIQVVMGAGGVAVVAHPPEHRLEEVERLIAKGAVGVDALRMKGFTDEQRAFWKQYAKQHAIILTGGTDWHKPVETWNIIVKTMVPYRAVEELKEAVRRTHGR